MFFFKNSLFNFSHANQTYCEELVGDNHIKSLQMYIKSITNTIEITKIKSSLRKKLLRENIDYREYFRFKKIKLETLDTH
jgi:hypothetical protein